MSYDAVLEQALEASQAKERELADQVASLRAKDMKRVKRIQALNTELATAYDNIGQLNSMIARQEQQLGTARRQVDQWVEAHAAAVQRSDGLKDQLDEAQARLDQLGEDEFCVRAPNLALAACTEKLKQLEGMLEAQRRSTRELGVHLQRARDEKTALQKELDVANERSRQYQAQRDQQFQRAQEAQKRAQEAQKRADRALSLARRVTAILDPITVTEGDRYEG